MGLSWGKRGINAVIRLPLADRDKDRTVRPSRRTGCVDVLPDHREVGGDLGCAFGAHLLVLICWCSSRVPSSFWDCREVRAMARISAGDIGRPWRKRKPRRISCRTESGLIPLYPDPTESRLLQKYNIKR